MHGTGRKSAEVQYTQTRRSWITAKLSLAVYAKYRAAIGREYRSGIFWLWDSAQRRVVLWGNYLKCGQMIIPVLIGLLVIPRVPLRAFEPLASDVLEFRLGESDLVLSSSLKVPSTILSLVDHPDRFAAKWTPDIVAK